jgi:signal transduction histidine kinase
MMKPGLTREFIAGVRQEKSRKNQSPNGFLGVSAAAFAHEFANELNVVGCAVQVMEKQLSEKHENKVALQYVKVGIARLGSLLNEFQSFALAQRLRLERTQLAAAIEELLASEGPRYAARGVRVEVDVPVNLPIVMLDAQKFRQALLNLCLNAVEAMPRGGVLTLRGSRVAESVCLEVIDTGEGIPHGFDVFALFTTTKPTGTGLGLPIVRQIISSHGGSINYSSRPGAGTIFRLTFPGV